MNNNRQFDIDYSTKMYPLAATKENQTVYKVVLVMDEKVDPELLEEAVNRTLPRYPHIGVTLEKNFYKYFLKHNDNRVHIFPMEEKLYPYLDETKNDGFRFKVSCKDNLIQIEVFHILTDGSGIMSFAKSVLLCYQYLMGKEIEPNDLVKDWREPPTESELEDGYVSNCNKVKFKDMKLSQFGGARPFRIKGTPSKEGFLIKTGIIDSKEIIKCAKERHVTVTAFLAGVLAYSIKQTREDKRSVVMMIPVNLRSYFKTETTRNFVSFVDIVFNAKKLKTIEDYIQEASIQLQDKTQVKKVMSMVHMSYTLMTLKIIKYVPLFIKRWVVKAWNVITHGRQSIVFTNLGKLDYTKELGINNIVVNMNAAKNTPVNVAVLSVGNNMSITFTRVIEQDTISESFFNILKEMVGDFTLFSRKDMFNGNYNLATK